MRPCPRNKQGTTLWYETFKGMSLSMAIIPSCAELIEASRRERVQDQATNFISGWMNSVIFLGEFLGPFIGGYLIEYAQERIKVLSSLNADDKE